MSALPTGRLHRYVCALAVGLAFALKAHVFYKMSLRREGGV